MDLQEPHFESESPAAPSASNPPAQHREPAKNSQDQVAPADLVFEPATGRSRRVRTGPVAAILATAVVLGVTALPAAVPRTTPATPPAKVLTHSPVERVAGDLAIVQFGTPFGDLEPVPGALLEGLDDGTERLTFQLRERDAGPDAEPVFDGRLRFLRPVDADTIDASDLRFFTPRTAGLPGESSLEPLASRAEVLPGSKAFRAAGGELIGRGDYEGIYLTLRAAPGSGVWCPGNRRFANLLWFREATTYGHAVPDMGAGEVAFRRARLR